MAFHFTSYNSQKSPFITLIAIFILISPSSAATHLKQPPFKKIYAFGDSFTDTGNTRSVTGPSGFGHVSSSPYGKTFFHRPTNRYSDGRLVIDFVAESLSLPFLPPYRNIKGKAPFGANFAVAGSTAINHAFFVKNNLTMNITPESIETQLLWFNKFLKSQGCKKEASDCKEAFDDALVWVGEIGVNDYAYCVGSSIPDATIRKLSISSFTQFLQTLLKMGAKYLVVQGLPSTGCLTLSMTVAAPTDRDDIGCVKSVNNQSYSHNLVLKETLQDLRKEFPHAVIVYADYWNAYHTIAKNPSKYGFKERFKACCGTGEPYHFQVGTTCGMRAAKACPNPSQYINWDGVHLTEGMYKVVADMFLNGNFTQPSFSNLLDRKNKVG